ncbi:hypothetical protein DNTS_032897 [Danionella cerebrum]|uniref:GBD/FH3 domain-containing protein n=1 Tax=Danionella cerebrum TaxID=2873325 RepID=A0A553R5B3_9TELE|nr:hypothetical protein DNTS_032897 [Danionella translucida]
MSSFACRVQFLDDTDPFNCTNFPEPTRAPVFSFRWDIPLINQLAGVHRLLRAPHKPRPRSSYSRTNQSSVTDVQRPVLQIQASERVLSQEEFCGETLIELLMLARDDAPQPQERSKGAGEHMSIGMIDTREQQEGWSSCFDVSQNSILNLFIPKHLTPLSSWLANKAFSLDDVALQLSHTGVYLDLESSLEEQRDELDGFQQDDSAGGRASRTRGKKHSVVLRTQLSVRVHACIGESHSAITPCVPSERKTPAAGALSLSHVLRVESCMSRSLFLAAFGLWFPSVTGAECFTTNENIPRESFGSSGREIIIWFSLVDPSQEFLWLSLRDSTICSSAVSLETDLKPAGASSEAPPVCFGTSSSGFQHQLFVVSEASVRPQMQRAEITRRASLRVFRVEQDDKDLVHEFVSAEGLSCLIKVGAEADQNYQNYILRALGQIMLYVDGMNGVIGHSETIQWLYLLIGSKFRLVVKTSLKLLLVFVEYSESNAALLIDAIRSVDGKRGCKLWSNAMEILAEKEGVDTELLVFVMSLINKTLAALPDQDSFYDLVDALEEQGMESVSLRFVGRRGTDLDLLEQINIYEATLRHEDGDEEALPPSGARRGRRRSSVGRAEGRGLERRRSRRHSLNRSGHSSPLSPASPCRANLNLTNGLEINESIAPHRFLVCSKQATEEEEQRKPASAPPPPDSTQPSMLASLLARRRSTVRVPATDKVTAALRPSERLPYLPHSPFFLFSYDMEEEEEEEKPVKKNSRSFSAVTSPASPAKQNERPPLGGLLSSSYRQHQESLAAERERRRVEREERLLRIEREERNRHSRDYASNMEDARLAREERFKTAERLAAEEFERERQLSVARGISLALTDTCQSRSATPTSVTSQDEQDTPFTSNPPSEPESNDAEADEELEADTDLEPDVNADLEPTEPQEEEEEEISDKQEVEVIEQEVGVASEPAEQEEVEPEQEAADAQTDESSVLSDKERQNEEVNEKDNCSNSSVSSGSSTLDREDQLSAGGTETGEAQGNLTLLNV